ncbi:MAG: DUF6316 family protein [Gammaproteobacteria bacterium]|nr:DUF6316 family protein [Gammaproteobacteria bacterium]
MRSSDTNKSTTARSTRMYQKDTGWFFNTREGKEVGPFRDALEAHTQLEVYIRKVGSGLLSQQA